MKTLRFVGVIRQSRFRGEQAVSEEGQRQAIEAFIANRNVQLTSSGVAWVIIGWAIDIGVSADKYDPWKRPQLGAWLKKPEAWDGMISMKLDRLARNSYDFARFGKYLDDHQKMFVCSNDPIDMTNDMGRMFAAILSFVAEMDLKNIKLRAQTTRSTLNETGRYTGGALPYGRKAVRIDGKWKIINDPDVVSDFERILELFYEGKAYNNIAKMLNEEQRPPGRLNQARGKAADVDDVDGEHYWTGGVVKKLLRRRHLIGHRVANGVLLRDARGEPIIYCQPLMTVAEWNRLQKKMDDREGVTASQRNASLGRKVGGCLVCGEVIHSMGNRSQKEKDRTSRDLRYRCASYARKSSGLLVGACGNSSIKAHVWESHLERSVLDAVGHLPRMEKVYVPGEDHTEELEQVDDAITSLQRERDMGLVRSGEEYFSRLKALMDRRDKLLELPSRPGGWHYRPTGKTVAEYWESMDTEARNLWLQEMGVRLFYSNVDSVTKWRLVLGDLEKLPLLAQGTEEPQPS